MRVHVDDLLIKCKPCDDYFIIESNRNGTDAVFICPQCKGQILVKAIEGGDSYRFIRADEFD